MFYLMNLNQFLRGNVEITSASVQNAQIVL